MAVNFTVHTSERTEVEVYFTMARQGILKRRFTFTVYTPERTQVEVYFTVGAFIVSPAILNE